jgi:hypothetical protein
MSYWSILKWIDDRKQSRNHSNILLKENWRRRTMTKESMKIKWSMNVQWMFNECSMNVQWINNHRRMNDQWMNKL